MSQLSKIQWKIVVLTVLALVYVVIKFTRTSDPADTLLASQRKLCQSTFVDGDGPYYKPNAPMTKNLAPTDSKALRLIVHGKVFARGCNATMPGIVLDIWHADPDGKYQDTMYRGKVTSTSTGDYTYETVMPKGYGEGTGYRPPHIHFKVWSKDRLIITSEMFFPDVVGWTDDAYIAKIEKKTVDGQDLLYVYHDIILPE